MAFFQYALRAPSIALCVAILASCGGDHGDDTPDAAPADGSVTGGAGGSSGRDSGTGTAGTGGTTGRGGTAGTGGAGGTGGTIADSGLADANRGGAAGTTGADARIDTTLDAGTVDAPREGGSGTCNADNQCSTGHCVGGVCCAVACTSPGTCEKADGATCADGLTCKYLKAADDAVCDDGDACTNNVCFAGACVVKSPKDCNDNDQCTTDTCTASSGACVHTPLSCDDANPCTTDTCSTAAGCQHSDNNAATCSDSNACTDDVCSGGLCVSTPKNCSSLTNDCNAGVCVNGTCQAQPANANSACDEGLVSCDATGKCDTAGHCVGNQDACGTLATTCAACTNEAGCYNGRLCTCQSATPPVVLQNGKCVTTLDECTTNPCVANATCSDPTPNSPASGDASCTCAAGYQGDGKTAGTGCTDIDECNGANPCGAGSTACNGTAPPGSYTCTCAAGFTSIPTSTGPTCVCDMSGTYALAVKTMVGWDAVTVLGTKAIEESPAGGVEVYRWALRYQKVETNGSLSVQSIPCGGTAPDACDLAYNFAHAQYQPNHVWGKAKINAGTQKVTANLQGVVPGGTYTEPQSALLLGISLEDPMGAWPACRACVGVNTGSTCTCGSTTYTVTNKATWVDVDDDGNLGITNLHVPRGGLVIDGTPPDPPYVYTEPTACPRLTANPGTFTYQEWPGVVGISPFRTNKWYVGSRMTSGYSGSTIALANNACSITGTVTGPVSGKTRSEQRIQGCQTCSAVDGNSCQTGPACDSDQVDSYDNVAQTQRVESETFSLTKMTNIDVGAIINMADGAAKDSAFNAACNEMRQTTCPAGKNCTTP